MLKNDFEYYVADFPQRSKLDQSVTELNESLAEKLNPNGVFPLLVVADENLKIKKAFTSKISSESLLQKLNQYKK